MLNFSLPWMESLTWLAACSCRKIASGEEYTGILSGRDSLRTLKKTPNSSTIGSNAVASDPFTRVSVNLILLGSYSGSSPITQSILARNPERNWSSVTSSKKFRSEEHTSELQSRGHLVCRLLL